MIKECRKCRSNSMNEQEQIFSNGVKHVALYCKVCGSHNGYKPQNKPITDDFAMRFKITWGQYNGYELQNVDDKTLKNMMDYTKSEYLLKVYQTEHERRRRLWEEFK